MEKVHAKANATLPENGVPDVILRDLPFESNIQKMIIQKQATTVPEPTPNLEKVKKLLSVTVPNAVTMEKSSCDSIDYNSMYHNAFAIMKNKIRKAETESNDETKSFFSRLSAPPNEQSHKRSKVDKREINIRQYFREEALRDNIMAYSMIVYLTDKDLVRVVASSKSAYGCNVSKEEARLNMDLLSGKALKDCNRYVAGISNGLMDQFEPWYFGVAFAFCFKYCTGMPDMRIFDKVKRHRRKEDAPVVDLQLWTKIITRRCEKALSNSWDLGFCMSNLLFRSKINMSRSLFAFEAEARQGGGYGFTPKELESAACEICNAMFGEYRDEKGRRQKVQGDLAKIRKVKTLSEPARRILNRVQTVAQTIEGTNEVRTLMRYDTHAFRIAYGVPLFVTFSPDEKHNLIMIRLSRSRRRDPAVNIEGAEFMKRMGEIDQPELDEELAILSLEELRARVPDCDQRRAIIARDALACVDGFRTIIQLIMEHILGIRCCARCPYCSCTDLFGSNAKPEGGMIGRIDAAYGSIEAQKSAGSLHVHFQIFVQCLHQHTPLHTLLAQHRPELKELFVNYAKYKQQVCRQVYEGLSAWKTREAETEKAWKDQYENSTDLIDTPKLLLTRSSRLDRCRAIGAGPSKHSYKIARAWLRQYLQNVQRRQEMRQNHVHVWNDKKKRRMPLTHCQCADDPTKCKAGFPRTTWLVDKALVLCRGFLKKRCMPFTGKKNMIGSLHGPMNNENLNGCMPAILAGCPGLNFN